MARIRTVKPEFFTSGSVTAVSPLARLLFIGLWCEADREGRFQWSPRSLKLRYLPADDCDGHALLDELAREGLITYRDTEGDQCGWVVDFDQWQGTGVLREPISDALRSRILERDRGCCWCGAADDLHVDHVVPVSRGGDNSDANLRALCGSCNSSKRDRLDLDWILAMWRASLCREPRGI